jgi:glycosyltransferase involved in cell wall biosynthesis
MKMKKLVRIIGRMNGGGPARQVAYLHRALRASFDTRLIVGAIEDGEQDMRYLLQDASGVLEVPSMSRSVRGWSDLVSLVRITRILLREKPDIVHTHTAKAGVIGRIAALLSGVPIRIHTYHGNVFQGYFGMIATRLIMATERLLNRFTTRVIAISDSQAEELAERFHVARRPQIAIVRNGFDLRTLADLDRLRGQARRHLNLSDDDRLVVWAGRLVPIKNLPLLLEVVGLADRLPQVKFLVAGDGPLRQQVETAAAHSRGNLQFLGWQKDIKPLLAAADMVLLTSRNEGTPAFLIEAMAAGKPFIATAVGGVVDLAAPPLREISQHCRAAANGFLTPADPQAILSCIERLAHSPQLAAKMGAAGRSFALANHAQERLAEEITGLYRQLLAGSKAREHAGAPATAAEETLTR